MCDYNYQDVNSVFLDNFFKKSTNLTKKDPDSYQSTSLIILQNNEPQKHNIMYKNGLSMF